MFLSSSLSGNFQTCLAVQSLGESFGFGAWSALLAAGHYPFVDILNYH